jgi:hypothetical protein
MNFTFVILSEAKNPCSAPALFHRIQNVFFRASVVDSPVQPQS